MEEDNERDSCRRELEKILEKKEKSIKVDDIELKPACPAGENFAAEVFRAVVYGKRLCLGVWTDIRKSVIVKRVPDSNSPCYWFYNCRRMFQNEVTAYECILPMCQSYLEGKSRNEENELCFPKYYGQCQSFLVLQDLQTEGYQQVNKVKGFSVKECSLVLRELSKFHAVSFALKKHDRNSFSKNVDKLEEEIFREEHINDMMGVFWENAIKFAAKSMSETGNPRFKKAVDTLNGYSGKIYQTVIDIIKPELSKFEVLCHGDLWSNNIMFRYCDSGFPVSVKFVDLQAMRCSSCVLDVMHVLFTSSRPSVYERHLHLLLSEYYNTLVSNLKDLDTSPGFTFEEFIGELKRKISFGLFLACLMLTCVTRNTPPDLSQEKMIAEDPTSEAWIEKTYKELNEEYHERLHALIFALTDCDLI